jgi:hypothetical protein
MSRLFDGTARWGLYTGQLQSFKSSSLSGSNPAKPHSLFHDPSNAPQATTSLSHQAKATTARNGCNREAFAANHVAVPEIRLIALNVTTPSGPSSKLQTPDLARQTGYGYWTCQSITRATSYLKRKTPSHPEGVFYGVV